MPSLFDGFKDQLSHGVWVFDNNGAEADVDRRRTRSQEFRKVGIWFIIGRKGEEVKPRDGDMRTPVFGFGNQGRRPVVNVNLGLSVLVDPNLRQMMHANERG